MKERIDLIIWQIKRCFDIQWQIGLYMRRQQLKKEALEEKTKNINKHE